MAHDGEDSPKVLFLIFFVFLQKDQFDDLTAVKALVVESLYRVHSLLKLELKQLCLSIHSTIRSTALLIELPKFLKIAKNYVNHFEPTS